MNSSLEYFDKIVLHSSFITSLVCGIMELVEPTLNSADGLKGLTNVLRVGMCPFFTNVCAPKLFGLEYGFT